MAISIYKKKAKTRKLNNEMTSKKEKKKTENLYKNARFIWSFDGSYIKENAISISKLCIDSESTLMTTIDLANRKQLKFTFSVYGMSYLYLDGDSLFYFYFESCVKYDIRKKKIIGLQRG